MTARPVSPMSSKPKNNIRCNRGWRHPLIGTPPPLHQAAANAPPTAVVIDRDHRNLTDWPPAHGRLLRPLQAPPPSPRPPIGCTHTSFPNNNNNSAKANNNNNDKTGIMAATQAYLADLVEHHFLHLVTTRTTPAPAAAATPAYRGIRPHWGTRVWPCLYPRNSVASGSGPPGGPRNTRYLRIFPGCPQPLRTGPCG